MDGIADFLDRLFARVRDTAPSPAPTTSDRPAPSSARHEPEVAAVLDRPVGPGLGPLGPAIHGSHLADADRQVEARRTRTIESRLTGGLAAHDAIYGPSLLGGAPRPGTRPTGSLASGAMR